MEQGKRFPRRDETYKIIGACFEVYKEKGCGFLEPVYQECLELEFALQGIPFAAQKSLPLKYKGQKLTRTYAPDFICFGDIIVEIKAVSNLVDEHRAQLLNYMNAVRAEVGLLVNFGHYPLLEHERFILGDGRLASKAPFPQHSVCSVGQVRSV